MPKKEKDQTRLSIIMTMCFQNDFIENLNKIPKKDWKIFPKGVHINLDENDRLWGNELERFIRSMMKGGKDFGMIERPEEERPKESASHMYHFIHLRDWHDPTDLSPAVQREFRTFGNHCVIGTHGAKFISPLDEYVRKHRKFNLVVNSNSLNSFVETDLYSHLDSIGRIARCSKDQIAIGIIGVATNIKIQFLVYDLTVLHGYTNVFLCKDLCAAFDSDAHAQGIEFIKNILDVESYPIKEFTEKLRLEQ